MFCDIPYKYKNTPPPPFRCETSVSAQNETFDFGGETT